MNICIFNGNMTKDIEMRTTTSGKPVGSFGIAVNEGKDKTLFVDCVAWDKTAELIKQYCKKGDRLCITGRMDKRSYDKDGRTVWVTEIIVDKFDFPPKKAEISQAKDDGPYVPPLDELDEGIPF